MNRIVAIILLFAILPCVAGDKKPDEAKPADTKEFTKDDLIGKWKMPTQAGAKQHYIEFTKDGKAISNVRGATVEHVWDADFTQKPAQLSLRTKSGTISERYIIEFTTKDALRVGTNKTDDHPTPIRPSSFDDATKVMKWERDK